MLVHALSKGRAQLCQGRGTCLQQSTLVILGGGYHCPCLMVKTHASAVVLLLHGLKGLAHSADQRSQIVEAPFLSCSSFNSHPFSGVDRSEEQASVHCLDR